MGKWVDESYINRCGIDELRQMLVQSLEFEFALKDAILKRAELPEPLVLHRLGEMGQWPEDKDLGKQLQRKHSLDAIPPVSECETGAGLWWRILQGLKTKRPAAEVTRSPAKPDALLRQAVAISDIQLGSRVRVRPDAQYAADWPDEYVVVHMVWQYQDGGLDVLKDINIGIASDDEIKHRSGFTDGFSPDDLELVR